mmetsp:Transcript_16831/g.34468  ORF Transcript_16831/g.34468 Transcript_16831/m.34468 type:complete len:748 (+) Transcript_16831:116-2359(+)
MTESVTATNKPTRKRQRLSPKQIAIRQKEREAAQCTLNGNGMNGSLPPLPTSGTDDEDQGSGFDTLFGHPYGALPYGNIHFSAPPSSTSSDEPWHPDVVRHKGLGPLLHRLNDEQIVSILSFVDGPTLAKGVVATSRFLYVAGHHAELWRDLTLRRWGEVGFEVPSPAVSVTSDNEDSNDDTRNYVKNRDIGIGGRDEEKKDDMEAIVHEPTTADNNTNKYSDSSTLPKEGLTTTTTTTTPDNHHHKLSGCWKDIYAINHYKATSSNDDTQHNPKPRHHVPIPISGIYSDTFFRSFLCRSFSLHPSWLSTHTVSTISHSELTPQIFFRDYEQTNTPLLIKGASATWPALRKWTPDYLRNLTRNRTFRATSGAAPLPALFDMENYFKYCASAVEEAPLYLFDRTFAKKCPELLKDFEGGLRETCPFWCAEWDGVNGIDEGGDGGGRRGYHDLLRVLGEERRPDYQWLIVGPKRSGSAFHIDPNATHAWNAPIIGRKRWIFYPPGSTPPGVYPSPDGDEVCMPLSLGEWFLTYWDAHVERRKDEDVTRRPLECTACPGDVLFVPHGWWHLVLNLGEDGEDDGAVEDRGVSVALTRNYVSASNLPDVLRFLDTRVSQISGCRDREEAVKPEDLGREFRKSLLNFAKEEGDDGSSCEECKSTSNGRGKLADLLERSEKVAKEGWQCAAWKDLDDAENDEQCGNDAVACQKKGTGTSILARAKLPSEGETSDHTAKNNNDASVGGGFSFSFM